MPARIVVILFLLTGGCASTVDDDPHVHRVPTEFGTLQAAVDAAIDGDTVVAAPGAYDERLTLYTTLTLVAEAVDAGASAFDSAAVAQTILDGGGGDFVIRVAPGARPAPTIRGFTLRNATAGVRAEASVVLSHSRVTDATDGVRVVDGSTHVTDAHLSHNVDDGIDVRGPAELTVERSVLEQNGGDGVEVQLVPYSGLPRRLVLRDNRILRNGENGVQLVGHDVRTDRRFLFVRNVIAFNRDAGIGMIGGGRADETFEGASLPEPIDLLHNTIAWNDHGLTGGDRVVGVSNVIAGNRAVGVKNVDGQSVLAHTAFAGNGLADLDANVDAETRLDTYLRLDSVTFAPRSASPLIDAGPVDFVWKGRSVFHHAPGTYAGTAPDLGAVEVRPVDDPAAPSAAPPDSIPSGASSPSRVPPTN